MLKKLKDSQKFNSLIFIILLIILGGFLRFYNLNWDMGNYFHPDERNIANAVSRIDFFSQLNPQFFAYGGFSIYLYRAAADILFFITKDNSWTLNWGNINIIGRFFSAFFSTITLIPIYILTKKISDKKTALLSAALFTFTVTSIQTAHYAVTESLITLIGVLICLFSVIVYRKLTILNTFFLGILFGIALATKTSAFSFILMPIAAYSFILFARRTKKNLIKIVLHFSVFLLISLIVFSAFSPYTFLSWDKFMESMRYESGVATGFLPVVYTLQFDHTIPYFFQITNFFWQIGIDTIFCILGTIFVFFVSLNKKNKELLIFSIFTLFYFLYVGSWHTKFIRYMLPIIPFLLIASSILLIRIKSKYKVIGNALIIIIMFITIAWSLAFFTIYLRPQTRISASKWVYLDIPYGSKILNEQWDDGLPIPLEGFSLGQYKITSLAMYDDDNNSKIDYLSKNLSDNEYIIFNSRRLYGTLIHLTDKYPITSKYYKLLFQEKLGYKKIEQFSSYPSFLGIEINDDSSEETFQVYDHPKVIILKNSNKFSYQKIHDLLTNSQKL